MINPVSTVIGRTGVRLMRHNPRNAPLYEPWTRAMCRIESHLS